MKKHQEDIIIIKDYRIAKILNKQFTKRILACFSDQPKNATEISNSISFPKEKIYYHLKILVSHNILNIVKTETVKGIEQKLFLPAAKEFQIIGSQKEKTADKIKETNINSENEILYPDTKNQPKPKNLIQRKIIERRRNSDRRNYLRRVTINERRIEKNEFNEENNRNNNIRRKLTDQRNKQNRRKVLERRFNKPTSDPLNDLYSNEQKKQPGTHTKIKNKNLFLNLNGINKAMTFVQSGNKVTFLLCTLNRSGFHINHINQYTIPYKIKSYEITNLSELVINVYNQFKSQKKKNKIYLAIQSDNYQCEMTYTESRGKNKKLFKKQLFKTLKDSYDIEEKNTLINFNKYKNLKKNAVVCYTSQKQVIENDYNTLKKVGLQLRYITSIPQILNNIYTYYNLNKTNSISLLIYIGDSKTHTVFVFNNQLIESREINKGLDYFTEKLADLSLTRIDRDEAINEALHFLSFYGIGSELSKINIQDGFPFKKAKAIINHLALSFINDIKECIYHFQDILLKDGYNKNEINHLYITGPGSHIKNLETTINNSLGIPVQNFSEICSSLIKHNAIKSGPIFGRLKEKNLIRKKDSSESDLINIKQKIKNHEDTIQSAQSPESAKYSLARLDIEKNSKIKSIDSARKKLITTSKEFNSLKEKYFSNKDELESNLESINSRIETISEELFDQYKEHDELNRKISELEFESDQFKNKPDKEKYDKRNQYRSKIKHASQTRANLSDDKESLEKEIDELESKILKYHDLFQEKNYNLEIGKDEITTLEYLKESIQNIANAYKRAFLDKLQLPDSITNDDLNTLQKSGYLIATNSKRIDEIKESFTSIVSGEINKKDQVIDGSIGIEFREKLLEILVLLNKAPDNLIHLKNLSSSIVKINNDQKNLRTQKEQLSNQIIKCKRDIKTNQRSHVSIAKDIDIHEKDLKEKNKNRIDKIDVLNYIRKLKEINDEHEYQENLLKGLRPRKKSKNAELKSLDSQISSGENSLYILDEKYEQLEIGNAELTHVYKKETKGLENKIENFENDSEKFKIKLDENVKEQNAISLDLSNALTYIEQLEKQCIKKKEELGGLNQKKLPFIKKTSDDKQNILDAYSKKLKIIKKEKNQLIAKAEKTKNFTIKSFFKKEAQMLKKNTQSLKNSMEKIKKEKEKAIKNKNKAQSTLTKVKKKNMPKIVILKKQISNWEADLKRGRKVQDKLEFLEQEKKKWNLLLQSEQESYHEQINVLESSIRRKSSNSYHLFLMDGLNRFNSASNKEEVAKKMAQESITIDKEEIKKVNDAFEQFKSKYDTFLQRYKKNHKDILLKLKPLGGKRKLIIGKIKAAKDKLKIAESMIQDCINTLDKRNELLINREQEFFKIKEDTQKKLIDIKAQIREIPTKQKRSILEIEKQLSQIPINNAKEITDLENQKKEDLLAVDIALANQEIMININKAEDKIVYYLDEIDKTNRQIHDFNNSQDNLLNSKERLEGKLETFAKKITALELKVGKIEKQFNIENSEINEKIDANRKEYSKIQKQLDYLNKEKNDLKLDIEKVVEELQVAESKIRNIKKQISNHDHFSDSKIIKNHLSDKKTKKDTKSYRVYLLDAEKDLINSIEHSESMIQEINRFLDTSINEQTEIDSTINLNEKDLQFYEKDISRIESLIKNNKQHLQKISSEHQKSLNEITTIKDLYPACKIMLNERITYVYTLIELKIKDKDDLELQLDELDEELKNKRVETAIIDQEISKIHAEMKQALEFSFNDQEESAESDEWKWEIGNHKMQSYMDIATLKVKSKELYSEITESEKKVAQLKQKQLSVTSIISESDRNNHKKIKRMEDRCTQLELQITREKNELKDIELKIDQLEKLPLNYGNHIETLKEELRDFKDQEVEHELLLSDLGRSIESIEEESDRIIKRRKSIKENTINLDYMMNLGLLMDHNLNLNLLPENPRKDLSYFRPNQIFQKGLLVLITVFSLAAFAQRSKISPLEAQLPIKKSELNLLNMRQEMKDIVKQKNTLSNNFSHFMQDDEKISSDIVLLLQYLSKKIPKNFKVTDLLLGKKQPYSDSQMTDYKYSDIVITISGFYAKTLEGSSKLATDLKGILVSSGQFKKVEFSKAKKIKKFKTMYTINLVY